MAANGLKVNCTTRSPMNSLRCFLKSSLTLEYYCYATCSSNLLKKKIVKEILNSFFTESYSVQEDEWPKIKSILKLWIERNLVIPRSFTDKLIKTLKILAMEINTYLREHKQFFGNLQFLSDSVTNICFNSYGTVDKLKTAKLFVADENFDVVKRFQLACTYCLEEEISYLWSNVLIPQNYDYNSPEFKINIFTSFYTCILEKSFDILETELSVIYENNYCPYKVPFQMAKDGANEVAVKYFGKKLSAEHQERFLVQAAKDVANYRHSKDNLYLPSEFSKVLMHLFSMLNIENIFEVMKSQCYGVLLCLLDFPYQDLFLEVLDYAWPYLSEKQYVSLLNVIVHDGIEFGYFNYDYVTLFKIFWEKSPKSLKEFVIRPTNGRDGFQVMVALMYARNRECLSLVLKDATVSERMAIVYYEAYWGPLLNINKETLEYIIRKCLTSTKSYRIIRGKILKKISFFKRKGAMYVDRQHRWEQFHKFVDETWNKTYQ